MSPAVLTAVSCQPTRPYSNCRSSHSPVRVNPSNVVEPRATRIDGGRAPPHPQPSHAADRPPDPAAGRTRVSVEGSQRGEQPEEGGEALADPQPAPSPESGAGERGHGVDAEPQSDHPGIARLVVGELEPGERREHHRRRPLGRAAGRRRHPKQQGQRVERVERRARCHRARPPRTACRPRRRHRRCRARHWPPHPAGRTPRRGTSTERRRGRCTDRRWTAGAWSAGPSRAGPRRPRLRRGAVWATAARGRRTR